MKKTEVTKGGVEFAGSSMSGSNIRKVEIASAETSAILAEIGTLCEKVVAGNVKVNDTFFSTKPEASRLKAACDKGDVVEVLGQLRSFQGEANSAELIARLEKSLVARPIHVGGVQEPLVSQAVTGTAAKTIGTIIEPCNNNQVSVSGAGDKAAVAEKSSEQKVKPVTSVPAATGNPQLKSAEIVLLLAKNINPHPLVEGFYPISEDLLRSITESMQSHGYDQRFPVQVVKHKSGVYLVWDGITRMKAVNRAGIATVPAIVTEFESDNELIETIIGIQNRRRSTTPQLFLFSVGKLTEIAAERAKANQGRRNDLTSDQSCSEVEGERANEYIARMTGRSRTLVIQAKAVLKDAALKKRVIEGALSINAAYELISEKKKGSHANDALVAPAPKLEGKNAKAEPPSENPLPKVPPVQKPTPTDKETENDALSRTLSVPEVLFTLMLKAIPDSEFKKLMPEFQKAGGDILEFVRVHAEERNINLGEK